jgi:hypothetical protein
MLWNYTKNLVSYAERNWMPESNSRIDSDWWFVQKLLDLSEGHSNALRTRMIVGVLNELSQRHADLVEAVSDAIPRSAQEEAAWLLALGKPLPHVTL